MKQLISLTCALLIAACAHTEFKTYEGTNNVIEGKGGTKVVIDGVEFWEHGEPPRKFRLIGVIDDERPGAIVPMMRFKGDIAAKAREAGADAVILISSQSQIAGYYATGSATATTYGNTTSGFGSGVAVPLRRNATTFAVIKYID